MNYLDQIRIIESLKNSLKENENRLHPRASYLLGFLESIDKRFDDRADISNMLDAIAQFQRLIKDLELLMIIGDNRDGELCKEDASELIDRG